MKQLKQILLGVLGVFFINVLSHNVYQRFDLTEDGRFTLSAAALKTISAFNSPVVIDILLGGKLPSEFSRLQKETLLLLEQFRSKNQNIILNLVDPLEELATRESTIASLKQLGLRPANVTIKENGKTTQELVFPWAMVNQGDRTIKVSLLKNSLGATAEKRINNSVQNLEYAFADAFKKLQIIDKKNIAVLKGNGELSDVYLADILNDLSDYYNIGAITLDSVSSNPEAVLQQLSDFDLALVAKPTEPFTEAEKYVMDQYITQGGRSLWLVDQVAIELDSLFNKKGSNIAIHRDLNLSDFFFKYGVRINPVLVNDLYNTPIVLANGEANDSQYNPLPWVYHPMVFSKNDHPINTNIEALRLQFTNAIDTLPNGTKKTILLRSSPLSKAEAVPKQISFDPLNKPLNSENYTPHTGYSLAVLLEGEFTSVYHNRIKPVSIKKSLEKGIENRMIIIADGDIIANQTQQGRILELGYDKWTNNFYGNKEFLVNCVNYLLDENGHINIRNKKVAIPLLDTKKITQNKIKWQFIVIIIPLILVTLGGLINVATRKRKFTA